MISLASHEFFLIFGRRRRNDGGEEKLKIQLAKEGVERKKKEDKARELAEAKARWEADQAREEQRTKSRERRSRQREDKLNAARAGAFVFIGLLFWLKWLCVLPCDLAL